MHEVARTTFPTSDLFHSTQKDSKLASDGTFGTSCLLEMTRIESTGERHSCRWTRETILVFIRGRINKSVTEHVTEFWYEIFIFHPECSNYVINKGRARCLTVMDRENRIGVLGSNFDRICLCSVSLLVPLRKAWLKLFLPYIPIGE